MTDHYRQGDVLLVRVESLNAQAKKDSHEPSIVLAYGEVTGHAHRLSAPEGIAAYSFNGDTFVQLTQPGRVTHEEHDPIALSPGTYKVVRQREYTPERIVRVSD